MGLLCRTETTQSKTLVLWRYPPGRVATKRRNLPGRSSAVQEVISTVCWRRIQATDMSLGCHLSDENFGLFPLLFELIYTVTAAKVGASSTFSAGLNNTNQQNQSFIDSHTLYR